MDKHHWRVTMSHLILADLRHMSFSRHWQWYTFYINRLFQDMHTINITYCTYKLSYIITYHYYIMLYIYIYISAPQPQWSLQTSHLQLYVHNPSASILWLPNIIPPHAKVKGAIVDGPFLSGRKSLAAIPMSGVRTNFFHQKFGAKNVDKVVKNQQKRSFTGTKAQEASSTCFCVCVCLCFGFFFAKMMYVDEEPKSTNLNYAQMSNFPKTSTTISLYFYTLWGTIRYGLKWRH